MADATLDIEKQIEAAREEGRKEGRREGQIETTLNLLLRQSEQTAKTVMEMQAMFGTQAQTIVRIEGAVTALGADHLETKGRVGHLENSRIERREVDGIIKDLKALETNFSGFLLKLALAGLTGGGAASGLMYAALKSTGVLP